jgi:hypothetical protein
MTKIDKANLLHFITKTGMYIYPVDDKNIESFIHGYELGTKQKCDFTTLSKQYLIDNFKIIYSNDGWPGQIKRLAKKKSTSWVVTFKQIALNIIAEEQNSESLTLLKKILKPRIESKIERINMLGNPWLNDSWVEEWLSLCLVKRDWFKKIWNNEEFLIIESIQKLVQNKKAFEEGSQNIPTQKLLDLKERYQKLTNKTAHNTGFCNIGAEAIPISSGSLLGFGSGRSFSM